jgi:hypothetical protein
MGTKSKPFRAFVEGETISDGRKVTPEMIDECVATFAPATYSPRINLEHVSGYSPEPPFNGYGDVVSLEAKTDDIVIAGKSEKRRALYAIVEGNDQLVALARADQKPFPSVELTPNYAGSGKFGIIGLASTDTPASIGTERLQFSHRAPARCSPRDPTPSRSNSRRSRPNRRRSTASSIASSRLLPPNSNPPNPSRRRPPTTISIRRHSLPICEPHSVAR